MKNLSILAAIVLPQAVLAHPGEHSAVSWVHLLTQGDHVATVAMIASLGAAAWLILRGRS